MIVPMEMGFIGGPDQTSADVLAFSGDATRTLGTREIRSFVAEAHISGTLRQLPACTHRILPFGRVPIHIGPCTGSTRSPTTCASTTLVIVASHV